MVGKADSVVEEALRYAAKGWKPYPIQPPKNGTCSCRKGSSCPDSGKHPYHDLGGLKSASSDPEQIKTIFSDRETNLGLICGSSFWVLDVDGSEGLRSLEEMIAINGDLPRTPTAETGGGRHYLFAFDRRIKKRTKIGGKSIDAIAGNQAIVAVPSVHVSGKRYRWIVDPDAADLAVAPGWLIDFATGRESKAESQATFVFEDLDLRTAPGADEGDRNGMLCRLVGSHLAKEGVSPDLLALAIAWGRRCDPELSEAAVSKTVANLVAKHIANGEAEEDQEDEAEGTIAGELTVQAFETIEAVPIDWLWPGRFALGKLTLLTGEAGVGKSVFTCDLAARISRGLAFPDGASGVVGDSFFVGAEDGAGDTIRPRLDAAGADCRRVHLISGPKPPGEEFASAVDLSKHIDKLDRLLDRYPQAKLLVIDPVMDYLGEKCNSDKATDVRRVLGPLRSLAEKHRVAIVAMNHLRKSLGGSSKNRSLGSGAFVQVCRIELRVCEDPEDADRRLLLPVKNNLGAAPGLAYQIESADNGSGRAVWEADPVSITIGEVESEGGGDDRSAVEEAIEWLSGFLSGGPVKASEAKKQAGRDGIAEVTLKRAKKKLRVAAEQRERCWWWRLPDQSLEEAMIDNNPQEALPEEAETGTTFVF
jgi:putative DNA primase/helicase